MRDTCVFQWTCVPGRVANGKLRLAVLPSLNIPRASEPKAWPDAVTPDVFQLLVDWPSTVEKLTSWQLVSPNLPNVPIRVQPRPFKNIDRSAIWRALVDQARVGPASAPSTTVDDESSAAGPFVQGDGQPSGAAQLQSSGTARLSTVVEGAAQQHVSAVIRQTLSRAQQENRRQLQPARGLPNPPIDLSIFAVDPSPYAPKAKTVRPGGEILAFAAPQPNAAQAVQDYHRLLRLPSLKKCREIYFEERWAGLRSYPTFARALGLIIDLEIDFVEAPSGTADLGPVLRLAPGEAIKLAVRPVTGPALLLSAPARVTAAVASQQRVTRVFPQSASAGQSEFDETGLRQSSHGIFVPQAADGFSWVSTNVDDALHKLQNAAEAQANRTNVGDVDHASNDERVGGFASWGLALAHADQEQHLQTQVSRTKSRDAAMAQDFCDVSVPLFLEDLRIGYRFDVRHAGTNEPWTPLCDRQVEYRMRKEDEHPLAFDSNWSLDAEREEGVVRRGARVTDMSTAPAGSPALVTHDEWFVWTDWPLSVPEPVSPDQPCPRLKPPAPDCQFMPPFDQRVLLSSESQTPLRFGHSYEVIAREVYADGSGVTVAETAEFLGQNPATTSDLGTAFEREQPIPPPHVHLVEPLDSRAWPGDQLTDVVVRSGPDSRSRVQRSSRWIVPAQVREQFAVLHDQARALQVEAELPNRGALDEALLTPDGTVPSVRWVRECAKEALPPIADATQEECTILLHARQPLPRVHDYYPDPLAERILAACLPDAASCCGEAIPDFEVFGDGHEWPNARYFRLDVLAVSRLPTTGRASWKRAGLFGGGLPTLRIALAPAEEITLQLWSAPAAPPVSGHVGGHAQVRRLHLQLDRQIAQQVSGTMTGSGHELDLLGRFRRDCGATAWPRFNPAVSVRLVHAVQRPCGEAPRFDNVEPAQRVALGESRAVFGGGILAHRRSTGQLDCFAQWRDLLDIDLRPAGPEFVDRGEQPVFRLIETDFHHDRGNPTRISLRTDSETESGDLELTRTLEHHFTDCRHRRVRYWLRSRSFFENYFSADQRGDNCVLDGKTAAVEVSIKASRAPDPPAIRYLVPRFDVSFSNEDDRAVSHRVSRTIRVWLDAPFFSSGEGQELAVLCWPGHLADQKGRRPSVSAIPPAMRDFVSRVGDDPVSPGSATLETIPAEFFMKPQHVETVPFPGVDLVDAGNAGSAPGASTDLVTLFTFPVDYRQYDPVRRQYPCDIEINPSALWPDPRRRAAFPYLRLILAAYQRESLSGAEVSTAVVADMHQLHPERTATVTCLPNHRRCLTITGYGEAEYRSQHSDQHRLRIRVRVMHRSGNEAPIVACLSDLEVVDVGAEYQARMEFERKPGHMALFIEEIYLPAPDDTRPGLTPDATPANRPEHRPLFLHVPSIP